ncbi:TetR/AcrR family transcriptional regulator [Streptomyces radicis]|uniref:TetR/AcrR family transcriptional regulator n=1 Tax=Streptomyces radicis TaxID=1750517 RepID=A0A3A9WIV5_9ACTN|nr:helix-turn-helix domain-containing protein [Streptomyces radicis]RKN12253.1 TetR/AcrR family transcriptional regulator [Streptomyces radicis]RKN26073.1 TetR/AcrR family transcriptional regulator [Streptomyces radicis]
MEGRTARAERVGATRESILNAAERLFAERGVYAVSNRQISEAAGQGNTAAVGYHFGTKTDLVRAIIRRHTGPIEEIRERMVADLGPSPDLRDWVSCLVRPSTEHLAALGSPTWYARFCAQVTTDPTFQAMMREESLASPALRRVVDGTRESLPELPVEVRRERKLMARDLIVLSCAQRERALARRESTSRASWHEAATGLVDALVGLWLAPVTVSSASR